MWVAICIIRSFGFVWKWYKQWTMNHIILIIPWFTANASYFRFDDGNKVKQKYPHNHQNENRSLDNTQLQTHLVTNESLCFNVGSWHWDKDSFKQAFLEGRPVNIDQNVHQIKCSRFGKSTNFYINKDRYQNCLLKCHFIANMSDFLFFISSGSPFTYINHI